MPQSEGSHHDLMSHLAAAAAATALGFEAAFFFIAGFFPKRPFGTGFALNFFGLGSSSYRSFAALIECRFLGGPTILTGA